jgi:hypothetical protein
MIVGRHSRMRTTTINRRVRNRKASSLASSDARDRKTIGSLSFSLLEGEEKGREVLSSPPPVAY